MSRAAAAILATLAVAWQAILGCHAHCGCDRDEAAVAHHWTEWLSGRHAHGGEPSPDADGARAAWKAEAGESHQLHEHAPRGAASSLGRASSRPLPCRCACSYVAPPAVEREVGQCGGEHDAPAEARDGAFSLASRSPLEAGSRRADAAPCSSGPRRHLLLGMLRN